MSVNTVQSIIQEVLAGNTKIKPSSIQIARFIFTMRKWEDKVFWLQGKDLNETKRNVEAWLREYSRLFRNNISSVNVTAGYSGYAVTRDVAGLGVDLELFEELYKTRIANLTSYDFTQSVLIERKMAIRWKGNVQNYYNEWDRFLNEGRALGLTNREMMKRFKNKTLHKNLVSILDRSHRRWKPDTYASMYAQTRNGQMASEISLQDMDAVELDIVQVSDHRTTTPICKQFEGRYYSLNGGTDLPLLPVKPPFHPNCKHMLLPRKTTNIRAKQRKNFRENKITTKFNKNLTKSQKSTTRKQAQWLDTNSKVNG